MKISRLFAVSMLTVTGLAVLPAAEGVVRQYRTMADKAEAIKAVEAFGAILLFSQEVVAHRAPYITPLFQEAAGTQAQIDATTKVKGTADAALAKARTAVAELGDAQIVAAGLNQSAVKLADVRSSTDGALLQPLSARDPAIVKGFLPGMAQVAALIEPILNRLQNGRRQHRCLADGIVGRRPHGPGHARHRRRARRHAVAGAQRPPSAHARRKSRHGPRAGPRRNRPGPAGTSASTSSAIRRGSWTR